MSADSIKRLIQCEKEAKESINNARKERDTLKIKAKKDALEIIERLKVQKNQELTDLEAENAKYLEKIRKELYEKYEDDSKKYENVLDSKTDLVESIVQFITGEN
ncbi:hypothetical protein CWI38_0272p0060 [Hamiltosporidium tvaerminnensis]|uniref:V-type proton ATPase subunit G n=2 Tax=Hamiltosporidium TaxID=1176354 RepID=A0A4Q9LED9_9MICR|nr:hypothetical protein LUQ84_000470 [Hamiltosporidium tvaerminnensis]TBU05190.1 hypothetical protein CWI36_0665p0040 [Hamiltosporidium magnivora]TBU05457.1 hypothetical protein CWI37_0011p0090 [Hamiltosporidium tvaerminnensis]TBU08350.1 hypothetical protein CWI39_0194p0050 [Hamiltosporidium magnivora]TBU11711.1 hypothetical protein CWI38_1072p0030 [Hamiltosporidium tvaerminnensis]